MKIGQLAAHAGLAPSAIRYYEKLGLLPPAERTGGQRRYSSAALDRVLLIRFASEMDFTLAEIKLFLNGFREGTPVSLRWQKLTTRKIAELRQRLAFTRHLLTFLELLQKCRCVDLHQCVAALGLSPRLRALRESGVSQPLKFRGTASWDQLFGVADAFQIPKGVLRPRDRRIAKKRRLL
jgi:DNA-binding transcriptional MerR regulator